MCVHRRQQDSFLVSKYFFGQMKKLKITPGEIANGSPPKSSPAPNMCIVAIFHTQIIKLEPDTCLASKQQGPFLIRPTCSFLTRTTCRILVSLITIFW